MFNVLLYIALFLCAAGIIFQIFRFRKTSGYLNLSGYTFQGVSIQQFLTGVFNTLVQFKLLRAGKMRWVIHLLVFGGFLYLLLVHGLHSITGDLFFDYYEPTLDPFQMLRNLFGLTVIAGCIAFLVRRRLRLRINQDSPLKYKGLFSIILIMLIIVSGFFLEASKIISEPVFMQMVSDYSDIDQETGLDNLKLYWRDNFNVYFSDMPEESSLSIEDGRRLNEEYCLSCHSDTRSAFVSFRAAGVIYFAGEYFNRYRADRVVYWCHYLLCLSLIVCLPFSRMFHIFLIPITSFKKKYNYKSHHRNQAFVSASSLYACTNCGYCSQVCSVYPHVATTANRLVLPHLKIEAAKGLITGDTAADPWMLQKGNAACTMCSNCTRVCPSGIDLQTLWKTLGETLEEKSIFCNSYVFSHVPLLEWAAKAPVSLRKKEKQLFTTRLSDKVDAFENCIQCTVCTNVCPIVAHDAGRNDFTPQQVMNLLRLGRKHVAEGTRMVHTCLTCYACQEVCPQEIPVTDILIELRNSGSRKAEEFKRVYLKKEVEGA